VTSDEMQSLTTKDAKITKERKSSTTKDTKERRNPYVPLPPVVFMSLGLMRTSVVSRRRTCRLMTTYDVGTRNNPLPELS